MKIVVVPNLIKKEALSCTKETVDILQREGCQVLLKTDLFDSEGVYHESFDKSLNSCDLFIAVGGDGTIIHTAKLAAEFGKPILGVNAGTLGFTAGIEREDLGLLPNLLTGRYREEKRLMLSIQVLSRNGAVSYLALNDAVVRGRSAAIIDYEMALGDNAGYFCRADGFIVATPTGSTAYSLSAGGPVIQPDMDCLVYTPVCPHALFGRSVIFGGDTRLRVTIPEQSESLFLTVDGETPIELAPEDKLLFSRADRFAHFLRLDGKDFYDVLNQKIIETR